MKKIIIIYISVLFLHSCDTTKQQGNDEYRVGIASFSHETCTFCPRPTGIEEFEYYGPPLQGEQLLDADSYIRGFVKRISEYGGVKLEGITFIFG